VLTGGTLVGVYYPLGVRWRKSTARASPARRPRCRPPRLRSKTSTCCSRARARSPSRWAIRSRKPPRATRKQVSRAARQAARHRRHLSQLHPDRRSQESGIKSLADLKGKSLSVGAPASGTELNARAIFAAAGMKYEDLGKVEYLPFAESVELIKNRQLDATCSRPALASPRSATSPPRCRSRSSPCRRRKSRRSARPISRSTFRLAPMRARRRTSRPRRSAISSSPIRRFRRDRLPDDEAFVRKPAAAGRRARRRQAIDPAKALDGMPCRCIRAQSVLQGKGVDEVAAGYASQSCLSRPPLS
jgi:hypothetical protein